MDEFKTCVIYLQLQVILLSYMNLCKRISVMIFFLCFDNLINPLVLCIYFMLSGFSFLTLLKYNSDAVERSSTGRCGT